MIERLGEIIVRSCREAANPILHVTLRREDQYRKMLRPRIFLDLAANLQPVDVPHPIVEEDEIGKLKADLLECSRAIIHRPDAVAGGGEHICNHQPHCGVIIREENLAHQRDRNGNGPGSGP